MTVVLWSLNEPYVWLLYFFCLWWRLSLIMFKLVRNGVRALLVASTTEANWRTEAERSHQKLMSEVSTMHTIRSDPLETLFCAWVRTSVHHGYLSREMKARVEPETLFYLNGAGGSRKRSLRSGHFVGVSRMISVED